LIQVFFQNNSKQYFSLSFDGLYISLMNTHIKNCFKIQIWFFYYYYYYYSDQLNCTTSNAKKMGLYSAENCSYYFVIIFSIVGKRHCHPYCNMESQIITVQNIQKLKIYNFYSFHYHRVSKSLGNSLNTSAVCLYRYKFLKFLYCPSFNIPSFRLTGE